MEREEIKMNIWQLNNWFDIYYAKHEQKYNRLIALKKKCDNGDDPTDKLFELYEEAERIRKRIQNLEEMLEENNDAT